MQIKQNADQPLQAEGEQQQHHNHVPAGTAGAVSLLLPLPAECICWRMQVVMTDT